MRITTMARNSRKPMPISVYVKRSSFIDGLRAIPTTSAAKSWPIPDAHPPTATMQIAHPSTDVPELRTPRCDAITEFWVGVALRIAGSVARVRTGVVTGVSDANLVWRRPCAAQNGRSGDAILETPTRIAIAAALLSRNLSQ